MSLPETCTSICSATTGTIRRSLIGPPGSGRSGVTCAASPARTGGKESQMGTMAPIRPTLQRPHRISLTAGPPPGDLLEVPGVVCRAGGVRLAAGVPGGGVAGEGDAEDEQCSRCADSSPRLLEQRPAAVPQLLHRTWHGPRHPLTGRLAGAVAASLTSAPRPVKGPHLACRATTNRPVTALAPARTAHPVRREGIIMHGFIKRAALAPGYGPVASDAR